VVGKPQGIGAGVGFDEALVAELVTLVVAAGAGVHPHGSETVARAWHRARRSRSIWLLRRALRRIRDARQNDEVDDVRAFFLGNAILSYFDAHAEDREELRVQLDQEGEGELMQATDLTWAGRIDLEATLRTMRENIGDIIIARFGQVSPDVQLLIDGTRDEGQMKVLLRRAATVEVESELLQAAHQA